MTTLNDTLRRMKRRMNEHYRDKRPLASTTIHLPIRIEADSSPDPLVPEDHDSVVMDITSLVPAPRAAPGFLTSVARVAAPQTWDPRR